MTQETNPEFLVGKLLKYFDSKIIIIEFIEYDMPHLKYLVYDMEKNRNLNMLFAQHEVCELENIGTTYGVHIGVIA